MIVAHMLCHLRYTDDDLPFAENYLVVCNHVIPYNSLCSDNHMVKHVRITVFICHKIIKDERGFI